MENNENQNFQPTQGGYPPPPNPPFYVPQPARPVQGPFPAKGKEHIFAVAILAAAMMLCNGFFFGGVNLGFSIGMDLCILASAGYLLSRGHRLTAYSGFLLATSLIIGAGFARSDDGFVKFVMLCFLFVSFNLGLTLLAGQQRFSPGGFLTLRDSLYTAFAHSFDGLNPALNGLKDSLVRKSEGRSKSSAIVKGLLFALPVVIIMVSLLASADAAFEAVVNLLPDFCFGELVVTLLFGFTGSVLLYSQATSLHYKEKTKPSEPKAPRANAVTVNTVLGAVVFVYLVYLLSQLTYFVGGFSGILPENYTMAQYARRGFFEMAVLSGINLALVGLCVGLVEKKPATPKITKLLCLFISAITVFFVAASSGKMFLYIGAYGLTRLRVLTQVIMLWLGLTTILVAVWLFVPKLPYMKAAIAAALVLGVLVMWVDVDAQVAGYNVEHYLSGDLEHIDTEHLETLNSSAVPHIARLAQNAPDDQVRRDAQRILERWDRKAGDFRSWNYAKSTAQTYLPKEKSAP